MLFFIGILLLLVYFFIGVLFIVVLLLLVYFFLLEHSLLLYFFSELPSFTTVGFGNYLYYPFLIVKCCTRNNQKNVNFVFMSKTAK